MLKKNRVWVVGIIFLSLTVVTGSPAFAEKGCLPLEEKSVKVEGWVSKKFKKQKKSIAKEFGSLGHTKVRIKIFPMGDTAKVVAIGRCVPAYIARHILELSLKYTGGVESLVNQAFYAAHWVAIGTTMFDEPSQQLVNEDQVKQLLNPELSTDEFHALYQKFSIQDETVPYFGLRPDNVKRAQ